MGNSVQKETIAPSPPLFRWLGAIALPAFIVIIVTLNLSLPARLRTSLIFEPPLLLPILQTLFIGFISFAVSYISGRSYLKTGSINLLLLGIAMLVFGSTGLVGGWLLGPLGPNVAVTVSNAGFLLASVFHAASAGSTLTGATAREASAPDKWKVIAAYLAILVLTAFFTIASLQGAFPPFFIQGVGPTLLRQWVLGTAVVLFAISALFFMRLYSKSKSAILYWYALALALTAVALSVLFFARAPGDPISWTGRSALYLSGIYLLIALLGTMRGRRATVLETRLSSKGSQTIRPNDRD